MIQMKNKAISSIFRIVKEKITALFSAIEVKASLLVRPEKERAVSSFYEKYEYFFIALLVLIPQLIAIRFAKDFYLETDSYEHALRFLDFLQTKSWAETKFMHDNFPFGQWHHFTRIMDVFLLIPTLPFLIFLPIIPLKEAVFYGGFLYQPFMAVLLASALLWSVKPYFGVCLRFFTVFAFFSLDPVSSLLLPGRSDHHVLLDFFLILTIGSLFHAFKRNKTKYWKLAGLFSGLAVWTTPEGFLFCMLLLIGLTFSWIFNLQKLKEIRIFSFSFALSTLACLLLNPPPQGVLFADNGRLSILFVVILGAATLCYLLAEYLQTKGCLKSFISRTAFLSFLSFLAFGLVLSLFGTQAVFSSPIPSDIYEIWAKHIGELKPSIIQSGQLFSVLRFHGIVLFIVCIFLYFSPSEQKKIFLMLVPAYFILLCLMLFSIRFCRIFVIPFMYIPPFLLLVFYQKIKVFKKFGFKTAVLILISIGSFFLWSHSSKLITFSKDAQKASTNARRFLPYMSSEEGSVLAASSDGPMIAWETGVPVIGSPYHTNAEGIKDAYYALNSKDFEVAKEIIKKRSVKTIILKNFYMSLPEHVRGKVEVSADTFGIALFLDETRPCYIQLAPNLPKEISDKYLIYHVDFKACEK